MRRRSTVRVAAILFWTTIGIMMCFIATIIGVALGLRFL